jgi:hypothetical protein
LFDGLLEYLGAAGPGELDTSLETIERKGDAELDAGRIHAADGAAVDLVGTGTIELLEHVGLDGSRFVNGAAAAEYDAA